MQKGFWLKLGIELLWWGITALAVYAVLYPIGKAMYVWPFKWTNVVFITVLITLTRYIFLLPYTFLARQQELKVALLLAMFPLTFYLVGELNGFLRYIEENTWDQMTGHLPFEQKTATELYIWREMIFSGAGSIISAPVFAARMFLSVWRQRNRGTV